MFKFAQEKNHVLKTIYGLSDQHIDALAQYELEQFKRERDLDMKSGRIYTLCFPTRERPDDSDICWHGCDKVTHVYGFGGGGGS